MIRVGLTGALVAAALVGCKAKEEAAGREAGAPVSLQEASVVATSRPAPALYLAATGPSEVEGGLTVHALSGGVAFIDCGLVLAEARGARLTLAFDDLRGAPLASYMLDPTTVVGRWPDAATMLAVQRDVTEAQGFGLRPYRWTGEGWTPLRRLKHYDASMVGPVWFGGHALALIGPWSLPRSPGSWVVLDDADAGATPPPLSAGECPVAVAAENGKRLAVVGKHCDTKESAAKGVWLELFPEGTRQAVPGLEACVPQYGEGSVALHGAVIALLARCETPVVAVFDGHTWSNAALRAPRESADPVEALMIPTPIHRASVAVTSAGVWVTAASELRFGGDADHLALVPLPDLADAGHGWLPVSAWNGAEDDVWIVAEDATASNVRPQALYRSARVDVPIVFSDAVSQALEEHLEATLEASDCAFKLVDLGVYSDERAAAARAAVAPIALFKRGIQSRLIRYPWRGEDRLAVQPGAADDPRPIESATRALGATRVCRHPAHPMVLTVP